MKKLSDRIGCFFAAGAEQTERGMDNRELQNDRDYFERRARYERAIALTCEDNTVALTHLNFADAYEKRLASDRPRLSIVA
jgi:hypothetical protein